MSMHFLQGAILRIAGGQVWEKESERWRAVSMCLGNKVCGELLISPAILSLTFGVMRAWVGALVWSGSSAQFPEVVQVGDLSEAGTEMVPSSSSLGMLASPS
jgi:hypothetical protein